MTRKHKPMLKLGGLSAKSQDMPHYIAKGATFDAPTRICGASMPTAKPGEITRMTTPTYRPGSLRAFTLPSRGQGC